MSYVGSIPASATKYIMKIGDLVKTTHPFKSSLSTSKFGIVIDVLETDDLRSNILEIMTFEGDCWRDSEDFYEVLSEC